MRIALGIAAILWTAVLAPATTLQRLSLEELTQESTGVIQAKVRKVSVERDGALIYTVARVEPSRIWKGPEASSFEVSSPGGVLAGMEQRFPGAPRLDPGQEYILFLWKGPSGRIQLTGYSQGVFEVFRGEDGVLRVRREAVSEELLLPDAGGPKAASEALELPLRELDALLQETLAAEETAR